MTIDVYFYKFKRDIYIIFLYNFCKFDVNFYKNKTNDIAD